MLIERDDAVGKEGDEGKQIASMSSRSLKRKDDERDAVNVFVTHQNEQSLNVVNRKS